MLWVRPLLPAAENAVEWQFAAAELPVLLPQVPAAADAPRQQTQLYAASRFPGPC